MKTEKYKRIAIIQTKNKILLEFWKKTQVRRNWTAGRLLPYGFEVRTWHQPRSALHSPRNCLFFLYKHNA